MLIIQNQCPCSVLLHRRVRRAASASAARCASDDEALALVLSDERNAARRRLGADASALREAPDDYYRLLRCSPGASFSEVKAAWRTISKVVHPDVAGPSATSLAVVLNLAVATLTEPDLRRRYDEALDEWRGSEGGHFDGQPVSAWGTSPEALAETEAVFVDECACIGCRKCVHVAPATFAMEEEYGRARVHTQWGDCRDRILEAVETCPVSVISYVDKKELALLEFALKSCTRENVYVIARRRSGNFGASPGNDDPFAKAAAFLASRRVSFSGDGAGRLQKRAHDAALAGAIASAWLQLDEEVRARVWPSPAGKEDANRAPPDGR